MFTVNKTCWWISQFTQQAIRNICRIVSRMSFDTIVQWLRMKTWTRNVLKPGHENIFVLKEAIWDAFMIIWTQNVLENSCNMIFSVRNTKKKNCLNLVEHACVRSRGSVMQPLSAPWERFVWNVWRGNVSAQNIQSSRSRHCQNSALSFFNNPCHK